MKLLRSIKMIALLFAVAAASAFAFEGTVDMKISTEKGDNLPLTYQIKGSQVRVDMTVKDAKRGKSMSMSTIPHPETGETHILMHDNKMIMVIKTEDAKALAAAVGKAPTEGPTFKLTGRKETIAGLPTEEMVGESEGKRTEIWVTKELGTFVMANQGSPFSRGQPPPQSWAAFAKDGNFFPLRVIQREKEGSPEKFRFEAVKVTKSSIPDATFVSPADYQRLPNMGDMMKGMMNGGASH